VTQVPPDPAKSRIKPSSALHGVAWTGGARVFAQAAQFVFLGVAARCLSPADFGTFTILLVTSLGLVTIGQAGWREYVITSASCEAREKAHGLSILAGFATAAMGAGGTAAMHAFHAAPDSVVVAGLLSACAGLVPPSMARTGQLTRDNRMTAIGQIQVLSELAGVIAGVTALHFGLAMVSLGIARLANVGVQLAGLAFATRDFGARLPRGAERQEITGFATANAGMYAVGTMLGPTATGLYRAGARFTGAVAEVIAEPTRLLAWSTFKAVPGQDQNGLNTAARGFLLPLFALAVPTYVGLAAIAQPVVLICLGDGWQESARVIQFLAAGRLLCLPQAISEPLLANRGHVHIIPRIAFVSCGALVLGIAIGGHFGLLGVLWADIAATAAVLPIVIAVQTRIGGLRWLDLVRPLLPVLVSTGLMLAAMTLAHASIPYPNLVVELAGQVAVGALSYSLALAVSAPALVRTMLGRFRRADNPAEVTARPHGQPAAMPVLSVADPGAKP
jgi:O-antigen/teichoic acid export membrane protein